ncbi:MAG: sigma-70 family RNA polymerase sigma factor [Xanthobacteraceae bacterium]|jgi:RNA polymerase sigma-70 factor (ECF subfamily)
MIDEQTLSASAGLSHLPSAETRVTSDDVLMERIAAGDRLAMQVLVVRHHVRMFRFVLGLVKDRTVAEDLIGDVFLDVWRQAHTFEARCAVATWLLSIARNKALSALRSRRTHDPLDEASTIEDPQAGPEALVQIKDRGEIIRRCLEALSPEHREIVDLAYYHEKTIDEVAEIVGIPLSTVKTRMFYARKRLAVLLAEAGIDRAAI